MAVSSQPNPIASTTSRPMNSGHFWQGHFGPLRTLLGEMPDMNMLEQALRRAETIGRPLGSPAFLNKLERKLDRPLKPAKRVPQPKSED